MMIWMVKQLIYTGEYENWVKKSGNEFSDFQKLWKSVMIRSSSEAICETIGYSIMNQHCGNLNTLILKCS